MVKRKLYLLLSWLGAGTTAALFIEWTRGVVTLLLATVMLLALFAALGAGIELAAAWRNWTPPRVGFLRKLSLASLALMFALMLFEGFLQALVALGPAKEQAQAPLTMPEEWKIRPAN